VEAPAISGKYGVPRGRDNLETITLFHAQPAEAGTPRPEVSDSLDPPNRLSIALRIAMSLALAGISPYE